MAVRRTSRGGGCKINPGRGDAVGRQELSMRKQLLGTIAALAATACLAHAQPPATTPTPPPGPAIAAPAGPVGPGGLPMATGPLPYIDGPSAPPGLLDGYMGGDVNGNAGLSTERGWTSFDYVLWFMRTMPATPLITTGTTAAGGIPGLGSTTVFGAENFNVNPL